MRTAINKKRIVLYAVCAFFFCLAGVFQAVDSSLPDFWHALFALLAHTILISLVVAWGVSLIHRMVRKDLRAYFITVAVLILFFLVVRMIRYGLTKDTDAFSRYLWYAYYVPQMFIPPTILLAAFSIESKKGKPLAKAWYFLYLPAVILLLLIFTNDVHEWAFALNFEGGFSYKHKTVFYIALAWEIAVTFASLIVLILKCGISACRRKTWIPVTVFIVCAAVSTVCFLTDTPAFKIPELLCFTCIVMIESCIAIGLIPSNDEYENYFYRSVYSAVITDENFNVIYNSEKSVFTDKILLEQATKCPVMIDENTRLSAAKIHGGYAFRIEDLSKVNEINAALSETNERLSEENYIIEAENELKAQKAQIAEQNKLYAKTDEVTREELKRLDALLSDMYHKTQLNGTEYIDKMRFACVLAAYIKRRSNLVILAEKQENIDVGELSLAIKESLGFLSLTGAECTFDCAVSGKIYGKNAGVFYDFFEACIANCEGLPSAVIVRLLRRGDNLVFRIECDNKAEEISEKIKSKFEKYNVIIQTDDEEVYYSLTLSEGGCCMRFIDAPFYVRQMIVVSFILTFVLAIIGLFASVRLCKRRRYIVLTAVTFALSFLSVFLTMCGSYLYRVGKSVFEPSLTIISLPLWLHCVAAVAELAFAVYGLVGAVLWNKKHISPVSIKESADSLPAGICFYEQSGLVRLINTEMNRLCVLATGKALLDGASFWRKVSQGEIEENCLPLQTGEKPIIEYPDGKVVSFKRYSHEIDGKTVYEIVATNVTERYRLTKELEQKQGELKAVNKRLVAYGDNVALLTKEKELLAAKIRIHDDMGKLLLATKRGLAEPMGETEQKQMICFWQAEIAALKSTRPRTKKDNLQVIKDAAKLVGVTVEFRGEKPKADTVNEKILIAAMHECLTNTVSHANGKTMTVTVSDKNGKYTIEITNDGEKPKGEIIEGGGLSGLRLLVERENGTMIIHSAPQFELIIELPQGETL